jgi:hypothetical protein
MKTRFCERCRVEIPAPRLEALPDTLVCIQCSREIGGEFQLLAVRESLGRPGAIKQITGGVTVRKRRKDVRRHEG